MAGLYEVEEFVFDGEELPPLVTESRRWRWITIEAIGSFGRAYAFFMDRSSKFFGLEVDLDAGTLELGFGENAEVWKVEREEPDTLLLAGELDDHTYRLRVRRRELEDFVLLDRGFRWVSESPYNRGVGMDAYRRLRSGG